MAESTHIGHISKIDGDGLEVQLTVSDLTIHQDGKTYRLGQFGSYVIVPIREGRLIGWVMGMYRAKTNGDGADAPVMLHVQLVGTLLQDRFVHGVNEYPIIGDKVLAAGSADFEIIFATTDRIEGEGDYPKSLTLGKFALDTDFEVKILGKEFFSKNVAILGNSGSGKSCTTARVLQQIMKFEQAQVVLFDLHNEYRTAFSDKEGRTLPEVTYLGHEDLILPYWLLRYDELEQLFVDYSNPLHVDNQSSFLRMALLKLKEEAAAELGIDAEVTLDTPIYFSLQQLKLFAENLNDARYVKDSDRLAFVDLAFRNRPPEEQEKLMLTRRCAFYQGSSQAETVHPLYHGKLVGLVNRIDTRLSDRRYDFVLKPIEHGDASAYLKETVANLKTPGQLSQILVHVLNLLMGREDVRSNLTIVDLSGIPFDMVDICVSLVTRLLLEFNFWTPPADRHPTLLVYEEAHNYIPRIDRKKGFARLAVEKVVKEGRKYGVSAMVISQRPSDLSETVLSQASNMIILRMNNPTDQRYVEKLVSDQYAKLVSSLPLLRPGEAYVIGDCTLMPMRTLIYPPEPAPNSADFDFLKHWSSSKPENSTRHVVDLWWRQDRQRP